MKTNNPTLHRTYARQIGALALVLLLTLCMSTALAQGAAVTASLTMEDAKAIALQKAQVEEADVFITALKEDRDDGRQVFEIEFITGGKEYEYDIDAGTGEIIKESIERVTGRKSTMDVSQFITIAQAQEKALAAAGVTADQATFTEIEFDYEDGRAEYELEFTLQGQRGKVVLDAQSGELLKYEIKTTGGGK